MAYMNIILAIAILSVYTIILCIKGGGIPNSLSASVFNLPQNKRWIWTVTLFAVCFLAVPTYIDRTGENTKFLAFISIAALAFVGAAPLVKYWQDSLQFNVHEKAAIICGVASQLVLVFNQPWLLLCWVPFVIAGFVIGWKKWRTLVFWAEMVCFSSTFAFCLID